MNIHNHIVRWAIAILIAAIPALSSAEVPMAVSSPSGRLTAEVTLQQGNVFFSIRSGSDTILEPSHMAMTLTDGTIIGERIKKFRAKTTSGITRKKSGLYTKSEVSLPFNRMTLSAGKYSLEVVAYDDGVAYRWHSAFADSITIADETNAFVLPADCMVWETPVNSDETDLDKQTTVSFENDYYHRPISELYPSRLIQAPILVELPHGQKLLISDYNTLDYPGMFLLPAAGNTLRSYYARYPATEYHGGYAMRQLRVGERAPYIARTAGKRAFPWKMFIVADSDARLLDTDVPFCLADDNRLGDVSWVKPGKVAWEWWSDWNVKGVDFAVGVNTATYKYWIDFAAQNGIEYVVMDEGWSVPLKSDLSLVIDDIDLQEIISYGKSKGVGIILWAGFYAFASDIDGVVNRFADMGVAGFKIDFIDRNDQKAYQFIEKAAIACARRKMVIDFHGIFAPVGFTHTFPNVLNFEGVLGLERAKFLQPDKYDQVRIDCILPFIRTVVGPMDYTQGAMNNTSRGNYFPRNHNPMSQGTRCRQLAEYVIFISPLSMLCDSPDQYRANRQCADFIASIPTVWDETRVIGGQIGEWVVEARRKGDTWYIGGITNWTERDVELDLSWLQGRKISIFTDGVNANRNAEDYRLDHSTVPGRLTVHMAPGGGFAAIIH